MAGFVVHKFTGEEAARRIDSKNEWLAFINAHKVAFIWGAQGPDTLFCDGGFFKLFGKSKDIVEYGIYMHRQKTEEVFKRLSEILIEKKDSPEYPAIVAFACGFASHYCVDSRIHAYVYGKLRQYSGIVKTQEPLGVHVKLEIEMDSAFYLERTGKCIGSFKLEPEMKAAGVDTAVVDTVLLDLVENVYGRKFPAGTVLKEIDCCFDKENFLFDEKGKKSKAFLRLKELVHGENKSFTLYYRPARVDYDVLNLSHAPWVDPLDPEKVTKASVLDLLDNAADETVKLIAELQHCIDSSKPFKRAGMGSFDCGNDESVKAF